MALPLGGIKVIDFTGVQAGFACTQLLAWFGAKVLKLGRSGVGDVARHQLRGLRNPQGPSLRPPPPLQH